jgi:hypothetical protein
VSNHDTPRWTPADCAAQGHSPADHTDPADVSNGQVWVVTLDDPEVSLPADAAVCGVFATEDAALAWSQDDGAETVQQSGGFSDPDTPWETEADGTHHASLLSGGELVATPHPVRSA